MRNFITKIKALKCSKNRLNNYLLKTETDSVYFLTSERHRNILILNFYNKNGEKIYSVFTDKKDYIIKDLIKNKWSKNSISKLLDIKEPMNNSLYCWYNRSLIVNEKSFKTISKFLKEEKNLLIHFEYLLDSIREKRLLKEKALKRENIYNAMKGITSRILKSAAFKNFLLSKVLNKEYIYYNPQKRNIGFCTSCNKIVNIINPKKDSTGTCPCCEKEITFKTIKNRNLVNSNVVLVINKVRDNVVLRYVNVSKTYHLTSVSEINVIKSTDIFEFERVIIDKNIKHYIIDDNGDWTICNRKQFVDYTYIYPTKNLKNIFDKTILQYSGIEQILTNKKVFNLKETIKLYLKYPCIEYFIKCGLYSIINQIIKYEINAEDLCVRYGINLMGNNLHEILNLEKNYTKFLFKIDGNLLDLINLRYMCNHNLDTNNLTLEQYEYLREELSFFDLLKYVKADKLIEYVKKQQRTYGLHKTYIARKWLEYFNFGNKLKLKNLDKYPLNLYESHKKIYETMKCTIWNDQIISKYNSDKYIFENNEYLIRLPKNAYEIVEEGDKLHHCVATYIEDVATSKTNIFFIRQKKAKEIPFYTVEVKDNEIKQCKGKNNCLATSEVRQLLHSFYKEVLMKGEL